MLRWEIHEEYRKYGVPPISQGGPVTGGGNAWSKEILGP